MRSDREAARKSRLEGRSYTEIQRILGIPKSTLSTWFSDLVLSDRVQSELQQRTNANALRALIARNRAQTTQADARARAVRTEGQRLIGRLSEHELLLIGVALYWAEGYKRPKMRNGHAVTHHPVSLTNADPDLVRMFLAVLRRNFSVPEDRLRISVRVFEHQNPDELRRFWSGVVEIPAEAIQVITVGLSRSSQGKRPYNRLPFGVVQVRVNDTRLFHKIIGAIEGLKAFR